GLLWLAIAADHAVGLPVAQPERQLGWTVSSTPVLEVGNDGSGLFGTVSAATRTDDGTWFVADRSMNSIVALGSDGSLRATIGREGDGPGEFRLIGTLYVDRAGNLRVGLDC